MAQELSIRTLETLKDQLRTRLKYLRSLNFNSFHVGVRHFLQFFDAQPELEDISANLGRIFADSVTLQSLLSNPHSSDWVINSEEEMAAFSLELLRKVAIESTAPRGLYSPIHSRHAITHAQIDQMVLDDRMLTTFKGLILEPLFIFLSEQLDPRRSMLVLLRKYKHRSEWFQREALNKLYRDDSKRGEARLARDLYEYLFDHGVEFSIEEASASGEIDLIAAQASDDPLLADAKIFSGVTGYLCKGFGQLFRYTCDFNQSTGYLVIFNVTDKDILVTNSTSNGQIPFVEYNHKRIYFVVIDIHSHTKPASKRGTIQSVIIKEEDLYSAMTLTN